MTQDAWKEIRTKIEGLGKQLKLHMDQERGKVSDEVDDAEESAEHTSDTRAAVEDLGDKIQEAFAGFTGASKDPAVKAEVKELGAMLKEAMLDTLSTVGAEVGDSFKKAGDRGKKSSGDEPTDDQASDDQ